MRLLDQMVSFGWWSPVKWLGCGREVTVSPGWNAGALRVAALLVGLLVAGPGIVESQEPISPSLDPGMDRVQFRESRAEQVRTIHGVVIDLQAKHLELKLPTGGTRRIARAEIVSVQLLNHVPLAKSNQAAAAGKFDEARRGFEEVARGNVPHWMKRYAAGRRIQCLRCLQQYRVAISDFVNLVNDDPNQIPYEVAPLVWSSPVVDALLEEQIKAWLESSNEWEQWMGASLGLLHPPTSAASQKVFEAVAATGNSPTEFGPREAIAIAQLWRLPQPRSREQLKIMQAQLEAFPPEVKAGPLLVVGKHWKGAGEPKLAADAFLQLASLYPEQHDLVLLGLEAAYYTLRELDREDAVRVGEWLVARHPDAMQTDEIRKELGL